MSERGRYWRKMLGEWRRSGLSQAEFCRRRGIQAVTLAWWKRRLGGTDLGSGARGRRAQGPTPTGFVELALPRGAAAGDARRAGSVAPPPGCYEFVLPGGVELRLPDDFDPQRVARLVQAVLAVGVAAC